LELTHFIAGPYCGLILSQHGAEVIKVEPQSGDPSRRGEPMYADQSLYFSALNYAKKSVVLNLKSSAGREALAALVASADIVVTNYRTNAARALGVDHDSLAAIKPDIITVEISGFGPGDERPGFDGIAQALSGISALTGYEGQQPLKAGVYIGDHSAGLNAALGAMVALHHRNATGEGSRVEVSILDSLVSMLAYELAQAHVGSEPTRSGNRSRNVFATTFRTSDGFVYTAPITDAMWQRLCACVDPDGTALDSDMSAVDRLAEYDRVEMAIADWMGRHTTDEVEDLFGAQGIPCGRVAGVREIAESDDLRRKGTVTSIDHAGTPVPVAGRVARIGGATSAVSAGAPALGEHTEALLRECGVSESLVREVAGAGAHDLPRATSGAGR
jgi:crotonobetainyl-CoA:carnitine CoA-transferase CaiB-like acyl-CoA transferase